MRHSQKTRRLTSTKRIHHRVHSTRAPNRHDVIQNIRLHHHGPRALLHPRSQTGPIHENPSAIYVHGPNNRHRLGLYRASRSPGMGPRRRHRRHLHRASSQQIQLPWWPCLLQRLRHLGSHRPQRIFSPGSLYANLQYFWLAGILTPILFYVLARMFPACHSSTCPRHSSSVAAVRSRLPRH